MTSYKQMQRADGGLPRRVAARMLAERTNFICDVLFRNSEREAEEILGNASFDFLICSN
jgi:hypothetical protein